jgi:hypothetical protein
LNAFQWLSEKELKEAPIDMNAFQWLQEKELIKKMACIQVA